MTVEEMIESVVAGEDPNDVVCYAVTEKKKWFGDVQVDDKYIHPEPDKGYDTPDKVGSAIAAAAGYKKYGKKGMQQRQKAGRG